MSTDHTNLISKTLWQVGKAALISVSVGTVGYFSTSGLFVAMTDLRIGQMYVNYKMAGWSEAFILAILGLINDRMIRFRCGPVWRYVILAVVLTLGNLWWSITIHYHHIWPLDVVLYSGIFGGVLSFLCASFLIKASQSEVARIEVRHSPQFVIVSCIIAAVVYVIACRLRYLLF